MSAMRSSSVISLSVILAKCDCQYSEPHEGYSDKDGVVGEVTLPAAAPGVGGVDFCCWGVVGV